MRISRSTPTAADMTENGRRITLIARKCPAASARSDREIELDPGSIRRADTARGQPIPGFSP